MIPIKPAYFTSEYSSYLYSFVESKRRCGYKYNGEVKELQRLDRFLSSNSQTPDDHSENVIYTWLSKKSNESVKTFSTRNSVYRQLYGYLALENDEPPLPIPPSARERIHGNGFTPYIFSHDEINRMFSAIDNEKNCSKSFLKYAPLLFRLLYATGLRINEALSLRMEDLTAENVVKFLDHLEKEGLSVSTRNQRLAVIKSFCKYIRFKSPRHLHSIDQILAIPRKKGNVPAVQYLSIGQLEKLLNKPNSNNYYGFKDLLLLTIMADTGARVSEIINIKISDIRLEKHGNILVHGKGNKDRYVSLSTKTTQLIRLYFDKEGLKSPIYAERHLFLNRSGKPFTRAGIAYILQKYATLLHNEDPVSFPEKITPHCLRHTKAMLMLEAGQNLVYIRDTLGHEHIKTTEIYARISSKQKESALDAVNEKIKVPDVSNIDYRNDRTLRSWLHDYCS